MPHVEQVLLTLREHPVLPPNFWWVRDAHLFRFLCCVFCFVCLRPVFYVPNVNSFTRLSIVLLPLRYSLTFIWTKRCFEGIIAFTYFVYFIVVMSCRSLCFQYGGSVIVTACMMQILRRMLVNQIRQYKQIALECLISGNGKSSIDEI